MSIISKAKKRQVKQLLDDHTKESVFESIDSSNDHSLFKSEFHFGEHSGPALLKLFTLFLQQKNKKRLLKHVAPNTRVGFGSTYGAFRKEVISGRLSQRNRIGKITMNKFEEFIDRFEASPLYQEAFDRFSSPWYDSDRKEELFEIAKTKSRTIQSWRKRKVYEKTERFLKRNNANSEAFKQFLEENQYSMEEHFRITANILLTMAYITETTI